MDFERQRLYEIHFCETNYISEIIVNTANKRQKINLLSNAPKNAQFSPFKQITTGKSMICHELMLKRESRVILHAGLLVIVHSALYIEGMHHTGLLPGINAKRNTKE